MGLDMYAYKTLEAVEQPVDFKVSDAELIQQWWKHPNLHGWMEMLYRSKGGNGNDFNCNPVLLDREDLNRLEADILSKVLPVTEGFFFGETDGSEIEDDLVFIENARGAILEGYQVFYDSWW